MASPRAARGRGRGAAAHVSPLSDAYFPRDYPLTEGFGSRWGGGTVCWRLTVSRVMPRAVLRFHALARSKGCRIPPGFRTRDGYAARRR